MTDPNPQDPNKGGENGGKTPDPRDEAITKLQSQVENLTKGIAGYRDSAQKAEEAAKKTAEDFESFRKTHEKPKEKPVELSPEDEKKFKAFAEEHGFLSKDDLEAERSRIAAETSKAVSSQAVAEFLEKHPEYDDDEKWKLVDAEFSLYKTPTTIAGYRQLFEKVHNTLSGGKSKDSVAKAKAELINKSRLSLGGGSGSGAQPAETEAAFDELQKRYPNLSRDQIEARMKEIQQLYPDKK